MVALMPDSETDGKRAHYEVKGIGGSFSNILILRSKERYKEVGSRISNSKKISIWKSLLLPLKSVGFHWLISNYPELNYFQDKFKYMHMCAHIQTHTQTHMHTHFPKCKQYLFKGNYVPGHLLPGLCYFLVKHKA